MIQDQKSFKALPYEVQILEGDEVRHSLKVHDATGTFRSIELDEHSEATKKTIKKFETVNAKVSSIIETNKDKTVDELSPNDQKAFEELNEINRSLQKLAVQYIKLTIKDWEKHKDIIDSVSSSQRNDFFACIRMASFGLTTENNTSKKKLQPVKSTGGQDLFGSKDGVTQKRKSKNGRRSN